MIITVNESLRNFEFWSGARSRAEVLTAEQLDEVEAYLEELYPEGMDETAINDFFWFEEDFIAEILGYADFETLERHNRRINDDSWFLIVHVD